MPSAADSPPPVRTPPTALTIAASDSSGAAGVAADLKTFAAHQVYGLLAITALTAQDSQAIYAVQPLPPEFIARQMRAVLTDMGADAAKTGLLFNAPTIRAVAAAFAESGFAAPLVVDPVLVAGDGRRLVDAAGLAAYREALFPQAALITPNLTECGLLLEGAVTTAEEMSAAALALCARYNLPAVLVKGGHLPSGVMIDILAVGGTLHHYETPRLALDNPRGTGCTFSAAITAELAKGTALPDAVRLAQGYLQRALAAAVDRKSVV